MNLETRIKIERDIARRVVNDALSAGHSITVNDGEEDVLIKSIDASAILKAMFSTDEDRLFFNKGWVYFIYGNDGYDVISDYTTNLEAVLKGANELAAKLERQHG